MLGARTGAWSGKRLPYDAEVEYIRAIGDSENSPWIDTKVRVIYGDEIYVEIMPASVATKFEASGISVGRCAGGMENEQPRGAARHSVAALRQQAHRVPKLEQRQGVFQV